MKHKKRFCLLLLEAILCMLCHLLQLSFSGGVFQAAAVPFAQIGYGLRWLSLSGPIGNAAAILLYVLLSLSPCMAYGVLWFTGRAKKADLLLAGLSILLFVVLYRMINPGLFQMAVPESGRWMPGAVFYSALFGYLILRVLQVYALADVKGLQQGLRRLFWLLDGIFVYVVFGKCFGELLASVQALRNMQLAQTDFGIQMQQASLSVLLSELFFVLRFVVQVLPYLLDIAVISLADRMMQELEVDRYSVQAVRAAARLADFCARALAVTVISGVAFHVLQLIFSGRLYQVDVMVSVPVVSVLFVLLMLLAARYIQENQKLKQENDLFI